MSTSTEQNSIAIVPNDLDFKSRAIEEIDNFLSTCFNIVNFRYKDVLDKNSIRQYYCLTKFSFVFSKSKEKSENIMYFSLFYNRNRNAILNGNFENIFLKNQYVQFGENKIQLKEGDECYRIMLSEIYRDALDNKADAESKRDLIDFEDEENREYYYNLCRDKNFLYKLSKIFYYIIDTNDRARLSEIVSSFEEELSIPQSKRIIKKNAEGDNIIGEIFSKVSNAALDNGIDISSFLDPQNAPKIDNTFILNTLDSFLNNPSTKKLFNVASGFLNNMDKNKLEEIKQEIIGEDGNINMAPVSNIIGSTLSGNMEPIKNFSEKMKLDELLNPEIENEISNIEGVNEISKMMQNFDMSKLADLFAPKK